MYPSPQCRLFVPHFTLSSHVGAEALVRLALDKGARTDVKYHSSCNILGRCMHVVRRCVSSDVFLFPVAVHH